MPTSRSYSETICHTFFKINQNAIFKIFVFFLFLSVPFRDFFEIFNPPPPSLCTIFTILLTLWNSEQKNGLLIKLFCFSSDFDETWRSCSYPCILQFHQFASKVNEKQKSFIYSPFFCSEFQTVSRIVKIVHSETLYTRKL